MPFHFPDRQHASCASEAKRSDSGRAYEPDAGVLDEVPPDEVEDAAEEPELPELDDEPLSELGDDDEDESPEDDDAALSPDDDELELDASWAAFSRLRFLVP